jgi:hypothetical protein
LLIESKWLVFALLIIMYDKSYEPCNRICIFANGRRFEQCV